MKRKPTKRPRLASSTYHDRIPLEDDFEILQARTSSLSGPGHLPNDTARSPLKGRTTWTIGHSWAPDDDPELSLDPDGDWYDEEMDADVADVIDASPNRENVKQKKKKSQTSARPHLSWKINARQTYLQEMLRWEGRGEFIRDKQCPDCISRGREQPGQPEFRCSDCFLPDLTCSYCCVRRHRLNPLHVIERWTGSTFIRTSLKDIGLVVHLNHAGLCCPSPSICDQRFRVLHTNGIHEVAFGYCACTREIPRHLQLLRRGFYPASQHNVRTCVSFPLLRLLHLLALTSKISTYDVYRSLERLTMNSYIRPLKPRYRPLMRVLTQWRHLKLLKRAGRGHDPSGVGSTSDGELAVLCPSCPRPGVNLPDDWENVPREQRFLYSLFICMDANFRLKNQLVSNYSVDPGLGIGWAYMLPRIPYESYVLSQADEKDISTCVGFQALAKATTRNTRGLRYTGVGAVICGRSEMLLPNAVGNLQKGERYANMDYIFASAVRATQLLIIAISYDIVCQWIINIFHRMQHWPPELQMREGLFLKALIPKFHEPAHKEKDHEQYSFNLAEGVGLEDGECPERVWGSHNPLANSTKTTGPGTLHDVYDDNFGFWNWLKYASMGRTLLRKYKAAVSERNKQNEAHRGFTESLPPDMVETWSQMCADWDRDGFPKTAANPFKTEGAAISEDAAEAELTREEEAIRRERGMPVLHNTSASAFLALGLELEDTQRRLKALAAEYANIPTNLQDSALKDQRRILKEQIQSWEQIRAIYIPGLLQILTDLGASPFVLWDSNPNPEDVDLWLPSAISKDRRRLACTEGLPEMELKLRTAQCSSSLHDLRQVLRLKTRMVYFKNKNIRGQRQGTCSRAIIDRVHKRAIRLVHKYRVARRAKLELEGPGDWENVFQELRNEDVRSYASGTKKKGPGRRGIWEDGHEPAPKPATMLLDSDSSESEIEMDDGVPLTNAQILKARKKGTGETRKQISWIWRTVPIDFEDGDQADDILRSEWARSRARCNRANEEVLLLLEEMRRVLEFLDWRAGWWDSQENRRKDVSPDLAEGLRSYAMDQAALQRSLSASFRLLWKTPLHRVDEAIVDERVGNNVGEDINDIADDEDNDDSEHDSSGDETPGSILTSYSRQPL